MAKISPEDIKRVKGLGCLKDKRYDDVFNVRVPTGNGRLTTEQTRVFTEAADRFGSGELCLTTRLTFEIQGVPYDNIEPLRAFLAEHGFASGGTGPKVRPVVSCKGTTCGYGLIDTYGLSEKLHERYYLGWHDVTLPHKFKIGVGGCPNNCVKPDLNDFGIIGQCVPVLDESVCRHCKECKVVSGCPIHVCTAGEDGAPVRDESTCNHCGRCIGACPFGAMKEAKRGYRVFIGGHWGKRVGRGQPLDRIFTSEEEIFALLERTLKYYKENGLPGERFADTIARLGFETVEAALLAED